MRGCCVVVGPSTASIFSFLTNIHHITIQRAIMAQDSLLFLDTLSTQLKYLADAAHLMAVNASACSSHIMSSRDTIMFANDMKLSESHRRHICGGCGTIKLPAWTVEVAKETTVGRRKKSMTKGQLQKLKERATKPTAPGAMVDICKRCDRKTHQNIIKPAPHRCTQRQAPVSRPSILNTSALPPTSSTLASSTTAPTASTNASSKKRAKSRKQGGLQALLAKNKEASQGSKGFGLDLMDLMR